jgi:hypothetical protein
MLTRQEMLAVCLSCRRKGFTSCFTRASFLFEQLFGHVKRRLG